MQNKTGQISGEYVGSVMRAAVQHLPEGTSVWETIAAFDVVTSARVYCAKCVKYAPTGSEYRVAKVRP